MDETFNTVEGQEIDRALLILCLNVGEEGTPEWSPLGRGVEDSSAEYDWQRDSKKDILGNTYNSLKKPIITESFDPWPLASGDKAQKKIWDLAIKNQDAAGLAKLDVLLIHKYAGVKDTAMFAERYQGTSVEPTSLGGQGGGAIGMATNVTFGGERTVGTAAITKDGKITFTAEQ